MLRPALRQRVKVRRLERPACAAEVPESDIVGENHDDIRLVGSQQAGRKDVECE
jgi:hypothetical protein